MIRIPCPHCGLRESDEFSFHGVPKRRPEGSARQSPADWRSYLYEQENRAGWVVERWFHVSGCRRFIDIERHTASNEVKSQ